MLNHGLNKDHLLRRLKSMLIKLRSLLRRKGRVGVATFAVARVTLCRRLPPGTRGVSKVSCKGLNTESNNPQRAPATVLVRLAADDTAEIDTGSYPGSGPSLGGKTPTSCYGVLHCLERFTVQGELDEFEGGYNG